MWQHIFGKYVEADGYAHRNLGPLWRGALFKA